MRLARQVLQDLKKDAAWILLFGIVASLIFTALCVFVKNYRQILSRNATLHKQEERKVYYADGYREFFFGAEDHSRPPAVDSSVLEDYFLKNFRYDGTGGFTLATSLSENTAVDFLVGAKTLLTSYDYHPEDGIRCLAARQVRNTVGTSVVLGDKTYEVELFPEDFVDFQRYDVRNWLTDIYVFCPTMEAFKEAFPHFTYDMLVSQCILVDPKEGDIRMFQKNVLEGTGYYTTLESIEHYLTVTDLEGERTHVIYVLLYAVSATALLVAMIMNLVRLMRRKFADYAVHHLYGEGYGMLYARMNLYALGYQSLALILFLFLMKNNRLLSAAEVIGALCIVVLVTIVVSAVLFREFRENNILYLRRKAE